MSDVLLDVSVCIKVLQSFSNSKTRFDKMQVTSHVLMFLLKKYF